MVLIAILAAVAVPGSVGSQNPSPDSVIDPNLFRGVEVASIRGTAMTIPAPDPAYRSDGALDSSTVLLDPDSLPAPAGRPVGSTVQPDAPRNPDNGRVVVTTVIDRGPYVSGRTWDLSAGLCAKLGHCYTGTIFWKLP
jgi:hypothetical protein